MKKIFCVLVFLAAFLSPKAMLAQQPVRINCGGPSYTDSKGQIWQADTAYSGGTLEAISTLITGTSDPLLYEDYHLNPTSYSFSLPNGQYQVNLYFAEARVAAQVVGGRVFDVSIQGQTVFPNLDIFAAAGANAALIKTAAANVTNGTLTIGFVYVSGFNPKINAIEILPGASGPSLSLNFKYPDGTPVLGTLSYSVTSSLLSFQGSEPLSNGSAQCVLYANPSALGLSAQFQVNLSLTDTAGHTLWQFTIGMNPAQVNLSTVQSSVLNVVLQKL